MLEVLLLTQCQASRSKICNKYVCVVTLTVSFLRHKMALLRVVMTIILYYNYIIIKKNEAWRSSIYEIVCV